jgi:hypothetical protein
MTTLNDITTSYCQLFGYSSCGGLSWVEIAVLVAVGALVLIVGFRLACRIITGV